MHVSSETSVFGGKDLTGAGLKERLARLEAIRKLIKIEKIKSQDTLLEHLGKEGFEVTQATLSRDLKLLKVGKISDGRGSYFYTLTEDDERQETENSYIRDFLRGCISIDWSGNIVVIKTHSGHSDPVAVALDSIGLEEILGTIAGNDNTVAVFLREGFNGDGFLRRIKELIPDFELGV
jgi:transcriptional regulator of arginine metabolism